MRSVPLGDGLALYRTDQGQSRARKQPPERIDPRIEAEILAIRDEPPEGLRRTLGPKAILYYLPRRGAVWESALRLPTSTRTVYQILKRNQRIVARPAPPAPSDLPRPAPLCCWQIDFKEVNTVVDDPQEPTGKKQHVAEAFNIVDARDLDALVERGAHRLHGGDAAFFSGPSHRAAWPAKPHHAGP